MISLSSAVLLAASWRLAAASPAAPPSSGTRQTTTTDTTTGKPPVFFLAGDSMTAVQSSGGGGWGNGFLSFLASPATGINYGHDGATTVSFVAGGDWGEVIGSVEGAVTDDYDPFVTIMFGANDQKATANISLSEYQANLENMTDQVRAAGGTPILVAPLSRRDFAANGSVEENLADQRTYTFYAAGNTSTWAIDLNQASTQYLNAIGNASAQTYDLECTDMTHLNDWGSVVFGRMTADLILGHVPEVGVDVDWTPPSDGPFTQWFVPNATLSELIWSGTPAYGGDCPLQSD